MKYLLTLFFSGQVQTINIFLSYFIQLYLIVILTDFNGLKPLKINTYTYCKKSSPSKEKLQLLPFQLAAVFVVRIFHYSKNYNPHHSQTGRVLYCHYSDVCITYLHIRIVQYVPRYTPLLSPGIVDTMQIPSKPGCHLHSACAARILVVKW